MIVDDNYFFSKLKQRKQSTTTKKDEEHNTKMAQTKINKTLQKYFASEKHPLDLHKPVITHQYFIH